MDIKVNNLSFSYKENEIFSNISFSLVSNSFLSIIGPNGSGKTTLLKCLLGQLKALGKIEILGKDLDNYKKKDLAKFVSYVPQILDIDIQYSVFDLILMGRYPHSTFLYDAADIEIVENILNEFKISKLRDRVFSNLSGGERQRVLIASAIAQEPKILILDEPTSYLDPKQQQEVLDILRSLKKKKICSLIMVSHDINNVVSLSDHVIALNESGLVFDDVAVELTKSDYLERIFSTQFSRINYENDKVYVRVK